MTVRGVRAIRLVDRFGHVDVAVSGPPYLLDMAAGTQHGWMDFEAWNAPGTLTAPKHWITQRALLAAPRVRTIHPPNGTLLPSAAVNGIKRFRAVGMSVQFDYPASFVPQTLHSTRRAGSLHGVDVAIGDGRGAGIIVTQFSPLPVPMTLQNVPVLAPKFRNAVRALARHPVGMAIGQLDGHPLLAFSPFRDGQATLKIYNVFNGDAMTELQCDYTAQGQAVAMSACREMLRTLAVGAQPSPGVV